jgi:hypothetical protein
VEEPIWPEYAELVARWEWPPWLKLTGWTEEGIHATDTLLKLYPSTVPIRDCQAFDVQPFGRCFITFAYEAHENRPCPIYEEFTFNDAGEVTFIEAWSDVDGLRPMAEGDRWAEGEGVARLSARVPGLGRSDGAIDLHGEAMNEAAGRDAYQRTTLYGRPPEEQVARSYGAPPLADTTPPAYDDQGLKRPDKLIRPGLAGVS